MWGRRGRGSTIVDFVIGGVVGVVLIVVGYVGIDSAAVMVIIECRS